ncbi:MAG: serine/threonine-protein kinase [Polyangia bacterium]|jgi:serine/threonine-protein kinase|nr:serine/threonine-protein kinase [Polyangia bacterium]
MAEEQKYKILEKLDSGGMAEVYVAQSEALRGFKKRVAIKRILPHLTKNQKFVQMFLDEARLSLQLEHANIVSVFDLGKADAAYFIVMEYVEGTNLKKVIESHMRARRILPIEQSIYIMRDVCEALAYAHDLADMSTGEALGIVHRDVSPPNILISKRGEIKMVDFGLAKATSQLEETDPGVVKGKFSYLSPEGASGLEVDRRADIFSVGILLFELLTGQRLFYGENDYHTVELVRKAEVPRVTSLNPAVPADMESILGRALAKNPEDRYQYASDLSEDLTRLLFTHGKPVTKGDISRMVEFTLSEQKVARPVEVQKPATIIDALIQEEILKFTSLDDVEEPMELGARPLSPDEISVLDPGDFMDPRAWATDLDGPGSKSLSDDSSLIADHEGDEPPDEATSHIDDLDDPGPLAVRPKAPKGEGKARPMASDSSPRPVDTAGGGLPAIVWVLIAITVLAAAGVVIVAFDLVKL